MLIIIITKLSQNTDRAWFNLVNSSHCLITISSNRCALCGNKPQNTWHGANGFYSKRKHFYSTKNQIHAIYYQWIQFRHIFDQICQNFRFVQLKYYLSRNNYVAFHQGRTDDIQPFPSDQLDESKIPAYNGKIKLKQTRSVNLSP